MILNRLIVSAAVSALLLTAPVLAVPATVDSAPTRPEVRVNVSSVEFWLPNTLPRETQMMVTIVGPNDEILVRETVTAPFFTWSPRGGLPEGDYRYEVRPILPSAGDEKDSRISQAGPSVRYRAGSIKWSGGRLADLSGTFSAPEEGEPTTSLDGPSEETDVVISDSTPAIFFDDTDSSDPDFVIGTNSNLNQPGFTVFHSSEPVLELLTDAGPDAFRSITVNATGDVGLSNSTLFVDRSSGRTGMGTTMPTQELHVVSSDGGDLRLSGSAQGELWDVGIDSSDGSLNLNDANTPGNAVRIEMGTPGQTLHLDSSGRIGIGTSSPDQTLHVAGSFRSDGDVALGSSRTLKTGFGSVNRGEMLARVADLPLASWRYKSEDEDSLHIGPFAEDFQRLFGLGDGETISVIDAQGVTLAAIQGLQQELDEKDAQIEALAARLATIEERLEPRR